MPRNLLPRRGLFRGKMPRKSPELIGQPAPASVGERAVVDRFRSLCAGAHRAGQRAIAAAEAWTIAEAEGQVLKTGHRIEAGKAYLVVGEPRIYFGKLFGAGHHQVQFARALLREDALGAARVKATPIRCMCAARTFRDRFAG